MSCEAREEEMIVRKTNFIIFSIAVIVFAGTFLVSLVSFPQSDNRKTEGTSTLSGGISSRGADFVIPKKGIHTLMGKSRNEIIDSFGRPERIDESKYGYQWYIYGINTESYMQIGIDKESQRVTTIYALGNKLTTAPFKVGEKSERIYEKVPVSDAVSFTYGGTSIDFELNEEDMMIRPLIKFGKEWVQLNFDHVTDRLAGVRYMSSAVLAEQHPYSMTYRGHLPASQKLSNEEWDSVNQAEDREIFDISNILRKRFGKDPLAWSDPAQRAAYKHSREMFQKNYFSHDSRWSGDLKERLQDEQIMFQMAGENIAAKYPDAIAATFGWLNSVDHRKNLLNDSFTELGAGSYHNYYTQDFIRPINP